jgi:vacuolar-type H+-ATPase subunit E/Vma4
MEQHVKMSLDEWKAEIEEILNEIDTEYEEVKNELKVYTYKYNITKQVVQSTVNPDLNRKIRELYHQPFEQKFNDLKEYIKDLEEKKRVFQMFTDKIDKATEKEDSRNFALTEIE